MLEDSDEACKRRRTAAAPEIANGNLAPVAVVDQNEVTVIGGRVFRKRPDAVPPPPKRATTPKPDKKKVQP